jgi:hypothetical protein
LGEVTIQQKIALLSDEGEIPFSHPAVYEVETMSNGARRVVAGVPGGDTMIFRALTSCLEPPYFVLYVLHTPRGEGDPGRYQSPALSKDEFSEFLGKYADFLEADSRFDIWSHSSISGGTVVWDRHNLLFAYGPLESYEQALEALGYSHGKAGVKFAHVHFYRSEFDASAESLLNYFEWGRKPLQPEDEQ